MSAGKLHVRVCWFKHIVHCISAVCLVSRCRRNWFLGEWFWPSPHYWRWRRSSTLTCEKRCTGVCTYLVPWHTSSKCVHLFAMRIGIWATGFGVTHLISSSIMPVRHPRIQFDRLHWLWHYCCSFSTWSIGFRQRHFISTWFIEFRKAALGFGMPYFI